MDVFDVIVVGGGNAALSAALAARHIVPRVLVSRPGNTFT
jgi:succinate dehydrogenase/fumarate reductase flavoprotein subunit